MGRVICIVGESGSGKTKLIDSLITELTRRKWNVAAIKHSSHRFTFEPQAKDTFKYRKAGAEITLFVGPKETVLVRPTSKEVGATIARYCWEADIVLAEGFSSEDYPKIAILRNRKEEERILRLSNLRALVSGNIISSDRRGQLPPHLPRFRANEVNRICDFIEKEFLTDKTELQSALIVNGRKVPIKGFVQEFLGNAIIGMVTTLKGTRKPKTIEVTIKREKRTKS